MTLTPTMNFRWLQRWVEQRQWNGVEEIVPETVLQQEFREVAGYKTEWRDVPLVVDARPLSQAGG